MVFLPRRRCGYCLSCWLDRSSATPQGFRVLPTLTLYAETAQTEARLQLIIQAPALL